MPQPLHVPTAIAAALLTAALANAAQFGALELETGDEYEAVRIKEGHGLRSLVEGHFGSTEERFALYAVIRDVARGAVIGLPDNHGLNPESLLGLSGISEIRAIETSGQLTAPGIDRLDAATVAVGEDQHLGPYAVAVADGAVARLVLVRTNTRAYVADVRLLDDDPMGL